MMRCAGATPYGVRLRALIVVLWRAGLRVSEALALAESDLDRRPVACWSGTGRAASAARSAWTAGAETTIPTWWLCRSGAESPCRLRDRRVLRSE